MTTQTITCSSCMGSGRTKVAAWDQDRYSFNEIDTGPCYSCGGSGVAGVYQIIVTDNTGLAFFEGESDEDPPWR